MKNISNYPSVGMIVFTALYLENLTEKGERGYWTQLMHRPDSYILLHLT